MNQQYLDTPVGRARLDWFPAHPHRATVMLGHGTATGVEAADLQALAATLPAHGFTVVLVTQPYRVDANPRVSDPSSLDKAWAAVWAHLAAAAPPGPIITGGRSAGSQVACRTAAQLGAAAVLVLAYPLRSPGSSAELTSVSLPALVVQGTADPFGTPADMPPLPQNMALVEIPGANHMFAAASAERSRSNLIAITQAVADWLETVLSTTGLPQDRGMVDRRRPDLRPGRQRAADGHQQPGTGPETGHDQHSVHGVQYTSWAFTKRALDSGLVPSMGSIGDCYDNAMIESFWGRMQTELLNRQRRRTRLELANAIFEYLEIFQNRQRRHSALGMLTPIEYELRGPNLKAVALKPSMPTPRITGHITGVAGLFAE